MTGDLKATLQWQYLDGPMAPGQLFVLRAPEHDAAIGCAGIAPRELWSDEQPVRAAQLANFAIERAHRTVLPAISLQRAVKDHVEHSFDFSFGFPNHAAVAVFRRVGYVSLGEMPRYVRVLRHGDYFERYRAEHPSLRAVPRAIPRIAGVVADHARLAVTYARAAAPAIESSLVWL